MAKFLWNFLSFTRAKTHRFLVFEIKSVLEPWATVNEVQDRPSVVRFVRHAAVNYSVVHQVDVTTVGQRNACLGPLGRFGQCLKFLPRSWSSVAAFPYCSGACFLADIDQGDHDSEGIGGSSSARFGGLKQRWVVKMDRLVLSAWEAEY